MADTIVKSFVIDTGQSVQNLKALETQVNATSGAIDNGAAALNDVAAAENNVGASSQSLKAQLRSLQAELANVDPNTEKYVELAQAASELKDKIGDAAEAVGTQAGGAFERVGGSLGLVTSRIANLDFEGAAEGAKLLAKNITDIKPTDIANGVKGIGSAFASVGKALLTNPIFLIGAAIAAAIVYSKELLSLIDGVTDAETQSLDVQKERAALAKEQVDIIGQQEESLKRQGYTEKEILKLKLDALDAAILEQQVVVETSKAQANAQIAAAERNYKYLKGFLDFVTLPQRKLTEFFFNFYNGAVDLINKLGFSFEKVDVTQITKGFDSVNDTIAKALFDPEQTKKEGEKVIKESEATLRQLTNQRDGLINAQTAKEAAAAQKAADDKAKAAKEAADAQLKAEQEVSDLVEQLYQENLKEFEDAEKAKTEAALKEAQKRADATKAYYDELAKLQDADYEATLTASEKEELAVTQKYEALFATADAAGISTVELQKKLAAEILAIQQKNAADQQNTTLDRINNAIKWAEQGLAAFSALTDAVFANRANKVKKGSAEEEKLAKQQFKVNKALQLSGATIDASKAITASLASAPVAILGVPNPAGIASLALATITGAAQVAKIAATQFQSSTPPSQSTPSIPEANTAQPAQFNPLAAQFIQNRPDQVTPRAFVLAGDVASQQEVRQKVEDLARIG